MYNWVTITDTIVLESKFLDHNLHKNVTEKAETQLIGSCSETYGYIVEIRSVEILSASISMADTTNRFKIQYNAKTVFPKKGDVYEGILLTDTIQHEDFCGGLFTVMNIVKRSGESVPLRVFVTNGVKNKNRFEFAQCSCFVICNKTPVECSLKNIVVDCLIYKDGEFRITGQHTNCQTSCSSDH